MTESVRYLDHNTRRPSDREVFLLWLQRIERATQCRSRAVEKPCWSWKVQQELVKESQGHNGENLPLQAARRAVPSVGQNIPPTIPMLYPQYPCYISSGYI